MFSLFLFTFSLVLSFSLFQLARLCFFHHARTALRSGSAQGFTANALRAAGAVALASAMLATVVSGRPLSGLFILIAAPILLQAVSRLQADRTRSQIEDSGLAYLHALRGLVQSGLGLSASLFRLAEAQRTPFATAMAKSLDAFDEGKTLAACLEHLHRRVDSPLMGATLRNLQTAYRQGLPVGAVLDQMVPALEAERDALRRAADLRRSAWAQAAIAFAVPWILVAASLACRPEGGAVWLATPSGWVLVTGALVVEGLGVWLIGLCSRFF